MAGEERIKYLADAVRYHRELYYNHSAPEISDAEFDALWDELKDDYIKKNPESKTLDNDNSTLKIPPEGYILPIPKPKNE